MRSGFGRHLIAERRSFDAAAVETVLTSRSLLCDGVVSPDTSAEAESVDESLVAPRERFEPEQTAVGALRFRPRRRPSIDVFGESVGVALDSSDAEAANR